MKTRFSGNNKLAVYVLVVILFTAANAFSQISDKVLSVKAGTGIEGQPLTISAELASTSRISQVLLAYRSVGSSEFRQLEAVVTGNTASATIRGSEITPSEIEYYFILKVQGTDSMGTYTYPDENPDINPLRVQIQGAGTGGSQTVLFLSPDPGSSSRLEDLLISISLLNVDSTVKRSDTKLYLDDRDVSKFAIISEDLITLVPENIDPPIQDGPHNIRVELYKHDGSAFFKSNQSFTQLSSAASEETKTAFKYSISGQAEARNENLQSVSTSYNRAGLNLNSEYGVLQVNGRAYVTNEDNDSRQPQNRFLIEAKTPWLQASFGDAYPVFPSLILSGKRVRGATANLTLGLFNFDFAQGEIVRKIEGDTIATFLKDSLTSYQTLDPAASYGRYSPDDSIWAKYQYGTFRRTLTAIRPSFGSGKSFQWGFSYLKSSDETGSIEHGVKPQENLAVGTDMTIAADNRNFLITMQGAASVRNDDISSGTLTDAQIDSLYNGSDSTSKREDLKNIRDKISPYITVNNAVIPLSVDKISSIMAGEAAMSLNYFNNFFKAGYIFRGSQYVSFGQTYSRKDVKGINIYDRLRLMQNQLFISASYEGLEDNLDQSKTATTTFTNINGTVSYFPRMNFPNLTIGYGKNSSSNGLNSILPVTPLDSMRLRSAIEDATTRFFVQAGYDVNVAGYRHNVSLGVSNSKRDDQTILQANTENTIVSAAVATTWQSPLQTSIGLTLNTNKNPIMTGPSTPATLTDFSYTTILVGARYRLFDEKLRLSGMFGPTFGDFERTLWNATADYLLMPDVVLATEFSVLQNPGLSTDAIWSLMLRYNM